MRPILARKGRLLPYLVASAPLGALLTLLLARPGAYSLAQAAAVAFPLAVVYAFLGLSAWYPCRSLPLTRAKVPVLLASHGGAAPVTSAAWVLLGAGIGRLLDQVPAFSCTSCRSPCTTCSSPSRRRGMRSGGRRSCASSPEKRNSRP